MVMEIGGLRGLRWPASAGQAPRGFAGTRWTSTVPWPFGPAPGAGMAGLGLIETKTQRDPIGPNQDPAVEVRAYVMSRDGVLGPAFDQALLPVLAGLGYETSAPTMKNYPLTPSWITDPNDQELFEAKVLNDTAGPFKGEAVGVKAGGPLTEADNADLPRVGTVWNVSAKPRDKVFNDGKLGVLLDALRKAKRPIATDVVDLQLRIFGVPKEAVLPKPTPVDEPKPLPPLLSAGVGIGAVLVAFNLLTTHSGSERIKEGW